MSVDKYGNKNFVDGKGWDRRFMLGESFPSPTASQIQTRTKFRQQIVKQEALWLLTWTALLVVFFTLGDIIFTQNFSWPKLFHLCVGMVFLGAGFLSVREWVSVRTVPWVLTGCATVLAYSFLWEIWVNPSEVGMPYVGLIMAVFGAFTLSYKATMVGFLTITVGGIFVVFNVYPTQLLEWGQVFVAAILTGTILLTVRRRAIDRLADASETMKTLATRDPVTLLLNRHGLEDRVPEIVSLAARGKENVFVAFIDIDGLKVANDTYGHGFGDEVIHAVADAIRSASRTGDLYARWGGDEFLVFGVGAPQDADAFTRRVQETILNSSGIDLSKWAGHISVGLASQPAENGMVFNDLTVRADIDMYRRRTIRRLSVGGELGERGNPQLSNFLERNITLG